MATTFDDFTEQVSAECLDANARFYILYLLAGGTPPPPEERVNVGQWEALVKAVEAEYDGNKKTMQKAIELACRQNAALNHLMRDQHFDGQPDARQQDCNTKFYVDAMATGHKPDIRPDMGSWDTWVARVERIFEKSGGDVEIVKLNITNVGKDNPGFADVLREEHILAGVEERAPFPTLPPSAQIPAGLSAGACPQLDTFIAYSKEASPEAYEDFHPFVGLWAFSAISNRRIFLPLANSRIYTNIMIMMCGLSTFFAKSHTANVAQSLLARAGVDFLLYSNKRMTPQKLLADMTGEYVLDAYASMSDEDQALERIRLAFAGQKALYYDEFGKMLKDVLSNKNSNMSIYEQLFLELYNCPPTYANGTIIRGMTPVQNPFITVLGSMTPANLRKIAQAGSESWSDGLFGRCSFLCPPKDAIVDETLQLKALQAPGDLVKELQAWHARLGSPEIDITMPDPDDKKATRPIITPVRPLPERECLILSNAEKAWATYRVALRQLARTSEVPEDLSVSYSRLPETALKFAMIMASMENNGRIEMRHWARAQELAEVLRKNLHEMYSQVNNSAPASKTSLLEDKIRSHLTKGAMTAAKIRSCYLKSYSTEEIQKCLSAMHRAGAVTPISTSHGTKYQLADN